MSSSAVLAAPPRSKFGSTLADQIANNLLTKHGPVRTRLRIDVADDVATLKGVATSFYQKQLWIHAASSVPGIARVEDFIEVVSQVH